MREPSIDIGLPKLSWEYTSWQELALCQNSGINFFNGLQYKEAKMICKDCSVRSDCLNFAIRNKITDGIWGGLTPNERASSKP